MKTRRLRAAIGWMLLIGLSAAGRATQPADGDKAEFEIIAIRATTKNASTSPDLKALAEQLQKQFKFTGYKQEKRVVGTGEAGKPLKADLVQGYRAEITLIERKDGRIKFEVSLLQNNKPVVKTTVTVEKSKYQLIGGPKIDGDDTLIVAVTAK